VRLVHVSVPAGKRDAVTRTLEDEGVDYVVNEESSNREFTAVVTFPLPTKAVEPVLDALQEAGLPEDAFTVVIDAQTVVSRRFDRLQEQYEHGDQSEDRIARQELRAKANELAPETTNYAVLTIISVVIATAGLLLDSPATVVGSMVIAPLIGPAMSTSVGSIIDDREMFLRGLRLQVLGFVLAVTTATLFALAVRHLGMVPSGLNVLTFNEVAERVAPDFMSLVIALGAGVAGAMSLRSGVSASLVGVMIAVALVPPVGVIGIGIAWNLPWVVLGATVLVLVNALSINLAALVVFWYSGYRPENWFRGDEPPTTTVRHVGALIAVLLVLGTFLVGITVLSVQTSVTEQQVTEQVEAVVHETDGVTLLRVEVRRGENPLTRRPTGVVATVGHPPGAEPPLLAERIEARLNKTGHDLRVEVRFVALDTAS
jgi:uncharacterized hydrophobic protein (TIGR00341 family)